MLSTRWYGAWDQFLGFSRYFKFLIDISGYSKSLADVGGYLISVEFSGIIKLVESSGFLKYRVDISGNFRLSKFPKFWFKVKVIYYKIFLFIIGGSK